VGVRPVHRVEQEAPRVDLVPVAARHLGHSGRAGVVQAAARSRLLRFPQKHFFSVLRTKLKWGER